MADIAHMTKVYVERICSALDCSQRIAANLLGLSPNTISNNIEREISEIRERTRIRIEALYYIVVKHLATVTPQARYAIINRPVFQDLEGNLDSVVTAIMQDKYELETLIHIATIAWNSYKEEELKDYIEIQGETHVQTTTRSVA